MHTATVGDAVLHPVLEAAALSKSKSVARAREGPGLRICKLIYPPSLVHRQDTIEWAAQASSGSVD